MKKRQNKIFIVMLLCVAISFTVIVYSVAASKGGQSSGDWQSILPAEEDIGTDTPEQSPMSVDDQLKVLDAFSVGDADPGNMIPEGSTVYYLADGTTEVYGPDKEYISTIHDSEVFRMATPNGEKPASHVFNLPNGAVIGGSGNKTIIYKDFSKEDRLLTIIGQTESADTGAVSATAINPGNVTNWLARAEDWSVDSLTHFRATWTVPAEPRNPHENGIIFYFNGIEDIPVTGIIQPILEWNQWFDGAYSNRWTGMTMYAFGANNYEVGSPRIDCNVGDSIKGTMSKFDPGSGTVYWWISTKNITTGDESVLYIDESKMPFTDLAVFCALEVDKKHSVYPFGQLPGSCYFTDMHLNDSVGVVNVSWDEWINSAYPELADILEVECTHSDDSWANILTPNVAVKVDLQGENRPEPGGWEVPLDVGFYDPYSSDSDLLDPDKADHYFSGTAYYVDNGGDPYAEITVGHVPSDNYDITVDSETTLLNVKRNVYVP